MPHDWSGHVSQHPGVSASVGPSCNSPPALSASASLSSRLGAWCPERKDKPCTGWCVGGSGAHTILGVAAQDVVDVLLNQPPPVSPIDRNDLPARPADGNRKVKGSGKSPELQAAGAG